MLRSIRWRLQLWHSLVLLGVVSLFGAILFLEARRARLQEIDAELQAAARMIEGAMRTMPLGMFDPGSPGGDRPPHEHGPPPHPRDRDRKGPPPGKEGERRPPKGQFPPDDPLGKGPAGKGPMKGPPPDGHPPDRLPPGGEQLEEMLLPKDLKYRYPEPERYPYLVIRGFDGRVVRSTASEDVPDWNSYDEPDGAEFRARQRGSFREVLVRGPHRTTILVGRLVAAELQALWRTAGWIALTGLGLWGLGMLGGLVLSRGVLRPIERMSRTAAEIAASDFSRRIESEGTVQELDQLVSVLNNAFDCLETALAQQTRFSADASHELRTPLAVILSQTEMALAKPRTTEQYQDVVAACHRAADRMRRLVESLLLLARIDAGQTVLNTTRFDLGDVAREGLELVEPLAESKELKLTSRLEPAMVSADRERLSQVVTNLLANAVNYNKTKGSIEVTVTREGDAAVLKVRDTGVGIAAEHLPHLFERFYRVDRSRSRLGGGSGLGLAIAKRIVDAHQGTLEVESAEGVGTTFTVRLPASG